MSKNEIPDFQPKWENSFATNDALANWRAASEQLLADFHADRPFTAVPDEPFFGISGLFLRRHILPALCGPFGRILPCDPEALP